MELDRALAFVADRRGSVLTTLKRDGRPQLSNVGHAVADGVIRISVTDGRAKTNNLRRDERASLHVTSDDFWSWVVIEGRAELTPVATAPDDDTVEELIDYYRTLSGQHPDWDDYRRAMVADYRLMIRIHPTHAYGQLP
ncbi:MAG: PPOX class F420-dependent oxidoreductase [Acidimicrobiia bacterium]|nr:PPOX class F420-dependent oxidoreductase [Acidimicrobiia bacterium]